MLMLCLVGILGWRGLSLACECYRRGTLQEEVKASQAVFLGQVIEIGKLDQDETIKVSVEQVWKGESAKEVTIYQLRDGKACQYKFQKGNRYLIYAFGTDKLTTNFCTRTKLAELATADMQELGRSRKP